MNGDKTNISYLLKTNKYKELVNREVTRDYRIAPVDTAKKINRRQGIIASNLQIADRVEVLRPTPAYVTLKDHEERFHENLPYRLINP